MEIETRINNFIISIMSAIENENWYAALSISLTLPDICSKIEKPKNSPNDRYPKWFDKYVSKYYTVYHRNSKINTFLTGNDAYALRCSFLHQGETNIEEQKARKVLNDYVFVAPLANSIVHNNKVNDTLQLQVDIFCKDIIEGIKEWLDDVKNNKEINERAKNIIEIKNNSPFYF
ncbi:hypothetical protein J416_08277 [Gracilibacillus halophilus YIM-C55.5]|uniref:Uncharacterized protein n=1 Tax=Gracilibacillus halophilus YIM-C55.5 TaxID=1308866 RepID=N4WCC2_9BACI|nr:hypothetical protein [Gracilibacillus halophilus]ENH96894.1 hypothetical protein J416_08277 [Gracilibacillus halophilus YIM-C55.5]